jgi:hypothetical protein
MTGRYGYLAETLRGELVSLGEMPLTDVTYGRVRNGVGEISANLALSPKFAVASAQIDATRRWRVVHVERDHSVMGTYVWWARRYDRARRRLVLKGAELWSLVRRVTFARTVTYTNVDQAYVASQVLTWLFAQHGADYGITVTAPSTGRVRTRSYYSYEQKPVGEIIEQLGAVIDGFDWSLDTTRVGDSIERSWRLHYPRVGRPASQNQLIVEVGAAGVELGSFDEDASDASTRHTAIGAGDGTSMLTATEIDSLAISRGDPLLDTTASYKDIKVASTLRSHAVRGLFEHQPLAGIPSVVLPADYPGAPLGSYVAGDDIRVRVPPRTDPFWPDGLDRPHRIKSWKARPPKDGEVELVELTFEEVPAA